MPTHDIIDNRTQKLSDHINRLLGTTDLARFAVGYFFLSGLEPIAGKLAKLPELRLLIGNTTNRATLEQIAEGCQRLDLVADKAEAEAYPKRAEEREMTARTGEKLRTGIELMDQTDEGEELVKSLAQLIEEKRLKVKVYIKGRMHAKAYIFDYGKIFDGKGKPAERHEEGIAIVGSSNLTLAGITHNTELNVVVQGNDNHAELVRWFDRLWDESQDFDETLMHEIKASWALAPARPYDIYMKALYTLVRERLEGEDEKDILWDDEITRKLAKFQENGVKQAVQMIRDYGGAFVADVVGLGKSYIGAAIVKHFERTDHARPLIICPAPLQDMWEIYNEAYELNARVLSMGLMKENDKGVPKLLLEDPKYRDRDFLLLDESHNFRDPDRQRYKVLQAFLATGRRCCFLTATPRNKSAWDVYHQIKLFHQDDKTDLPIDPAHLRDYFKLIEKGERRLQDLLSNILIRRTRNHILRWYGYDAETHEKVDPTRFKDYQEGRRRAYVLVGEKHQFFPKRELATIEYSIEDTYQGLYQRLRGYIGKARKGQADKYPQDELSYARFGLWHYVKKENQRQEPYGGLHRAGQNLRGLMRVLLFKRFESSVYAFQETVRRLLRVHEAFARALEEGIVPAGEDAQTLLYDTEYADEEDLLSALREVSGRYSVKDFDLARLREHIEHDIRLFKKILSLVEPITPKEDAKLQRLLEELKKPPLKEGKRLIFTQYADTARYLYQNLNPNDKRDDIEVIYSGDKSKARVVGRFAPKANPEYHYVHDGEKELMTVVATDVLAEGLNLQDCDKIINYDLHWNPVRLIQRFGRIDRIGTEHTVIYGFNFLPELGIEKNLGLKDKLKNRIQEIHDTIGEDSAILDTSEQLNEEAMYAIYEQKGGQLSLLEDEEESLDLNEAEEMLRKMRAENPGEFERIASLRDGIRTAWAAQAKKFFVFCQAGRYQKLYLLDEVKTEEINDIPKILGAIKSGTEQKGAPLPAGYNAKVMAVKRKFTEEVKHRQAEKEYTLSLSHGQRYVLRELRLLFGEAADEDKKAQINILEKAFRGALTAAVNRELNRLRRNSVTGKDLIESLSDLYYQHNMKDWAERRALSAEGETVPRVVCSEVL